MTGADVIELRGLRVLGRHGCLPEEEEREQPFELDLDLHVDLSAAARSDDLADTVDYGAMVAVVVAIVEGPPCRLLEALAGRIADAMLGDGRVTSVMVAVRKLRPPVAADLATAGVRLTRGR